MEINNHLVHDNQQNIRINFKNVSPGSISLTSLQYTGNVVRIKATA